MKIVVNNITNQDRRIIALAERLRHKWDSRPSLLERRRRLLKTKKNHD